MGGDPATQTAFATEFASWRGRRGLSQKALARTMGFDPSYVSHIEAGRHLPSEDFVRRADRALGCGGALWRAWQHQAGARSGRPPPAVDGRSTEGLIVEDDHATLIYRGPGSSPGEHSRGPGSSPVGHSRGPGSSPGEHGRDGIFNARQRRRLLNAGTEPVTRYLMRISVDRFPGEPERSNRLYRERPLQFSELSLSAFCDGEPMAWHPKQDRDSFKEVWLRFENDQGRFPLYPGQRAVIEYDYFVDEGRWGPWFQRAVRLPTRHLSVGLEFPLELAPVVWGTETSTTAEAVPLRTPLTRTESDSVVSFAWAIDDPPMSARYRLEWRFGSSGSAGSAESTAGSSHGSSPGPSLLSASDRMASCGIVQSGDPVLSTISLPYDEPSRSQDLVDRLFATMHRVRDHHEFTKGSGLAAPQIGVSRAAAIVFPPGADAEPLVLLNPRIIAESSETDEQYEGCLSFFDVRGLVPRPLWIEVSHVLPSGAEAITRFEQALARLVAHEIDHLFGVLYTERMRPSVTPIPVSEYRGTGRPWSYPAS